MAGLLRPFSLRTRLSLLVGFIVAVVVGAAAFLELRMFDATLESELLDAAPDTALRRGRRLRAPQPARMATPSSAALHQFLEVNPAVRAITVVDATGHRTPDGRQHVVGRAPRRDRRRPRGDRDRRRRLLGGRPLRFVGVPLVGPNGADGRGRDRVHGGRHTGCATRAADRRPWRCRQSASSRCCSICWPAAGAPAHRRDPGHDAPRRGRRAQRRADGRARMTRSARWCTG